MKQLTILFVALLFAGLVSAQNVGINIPAPTAPLDVAIETGGSIQIGNNNLTLNGGNSANNLHIDGGFPDDPANQNGPWTGLLYLNHYSKNNIIMNANGGMVGIGVDAPAFDLHVRQSEFSVFDAAGGIALMVPGTGTDYWKIFHSGSHFSFVENGVRRAYVEAGTGNYVQPSDRKLKEGVEYLPAVLPGVLKLEPARYHYINAADKSNKTLGFIAQDVQAIFPEYVYTGEDGNLGLAYKDFGILAVKAIQEQQVIIDAQTQTIEALQAQLQQVISALDKAGIDLNQS